MENTNEKIEKNMEETHIEEWKDLENTEDNCEKIWKIQK